MAKFRIVKSLGVDVDGRLSLQVVFTDDDGETHHFVDSRGRGYLDAGPGRVEAPQLIQIPVVDENGDPITRRQVQDALGEMALRHADNWAKNKAAAPRAGPDISADVGRDVTVPRL